MRGGKTQTDLLQSSSTLKTCLSPYEAFVSLSVAVDGPDDFTRYGAGGEAFPDHPVALLGYLDRIDLDVKN